MDIDPHLIDALQECVTALNAAKDELRSTRMGAGNVQRIVVTNEAKPDTPWLAHASVTAATVCVVLSIITLLGGGMLYLDMKDHLGAIYMVAPALQQQITAKETSHVQAKP